MHAEEERRAAGGAPDRSLKRDRIAAYSVQNVQRGLFRDFRDRRAAKVSPSSVNRDIALWSVVLGWARTELDAPLPADLLDGLKLQENAARERRLQPGEYESLLAAAPDWLRSYIVLAVETGMRRGELAALTWDRVDLKRRIATLVTAKNGSGRRVPLSSHAVAALERLGRVRVLGDDRIFPQHADNISKAFVATCRRAGITGLRLHDLRAECVSRLFERGLDLNSVKAISGHKSAAFLRYARAGDVEALALKLG